LDEHIAKRLDGLWRRKNGPRGVFGLLIRSNCSVERDGFAVAIGEDDLLGAGVKAGDLMRRVWASLKVTLADFPLIVNVVAPWKPLSRMVSVAPPVAQQWRARWYRFPVEPPLMPTKTV
jgi:hypothetical protein